MPDVRWVPLSKDLLPACIHLWSDRAAFTPQDFRIAIESAATLLTDDEAQGAVVFEGDQVRGFGLATFIDSDAADRFVAAPHPQFGRRLLLNALDGDPHRMVLRRNAIAAANAGPGLQLAVVNSNYDTAAPHLDLVIGTIIEAFQAVHRGFRIARIINEVQGDGPVETLIRSGGFDIRARFEDVGGVKGLPGALGILTREQAIADRMPLMPMFLYTPPRICFTSAEQAVLRLALTGAPDTVVAQRLGIPHTTVKARWVRIQQRAFGAVSGELGVTDMPSAGAGRGLQTRHLVLEYVRQHPSELTPYPRR
jgi:hypothetical protein